MKKLLAIYLSLSLALMPTLAKAQSAVSDITRAQSALSERGFKIINPVTQEEISFEDASEIGFFALDARVANMGYITFKQIQSVGAVLKYAVSRSNDLEILGNMNVSVMELDLNQSAEENADKVLQAASALQVESKKVIKGGLAAVIGGVVLVTAGHYFLKHSGRATAGFSTTDSILNGTMKKSTRVLMLGTAFTVVGFGLILGGGSFAAAGAMTVK